MSISGAYVQVTELPLFYDIRRLTQLVSDTGVVATAAVFTDPAPTAGNDLVCYNRVVQMILAASAKIDSVCQQGKRYAKADLEALAAAGGKSGAVLKQLAADLFFGTLVTNRGYHGDQALAMAPRYQEALVTLEALYQGQQVFDLDYALTAGVPSTTRIGKLRLQSSEFIPLFGRWPDQNNQGGWY